MVYKCDGLGASIQQHITGRGQDEEEELHSTKFVFLTMSVGTSQGDSNTILDRVSYRIAEKSRPFSGSSFSKSGEAKLVKGARVSRSFP